MSKKVRVWQTETGLPTVTRITPVTCGNITLKLVEIEDAEHGTIYRNVELPDTIRNMDLPELVSALQDADVAAFAAKPHYEPPKRAESRLIAVEDLRALLDLLGDAPIGYVSSAERLSQWERKRYQLVQKLTTREQTDVG